MRQNSHTIIRLAVHLPLQQSVYYHDGNEERALQVGRHTTLTERYCLTPLNENSHHINDIILQQLNEPVHTYLSTDRVDTNNPEEAAAYPMQFLNAQTPSGLPKHKLDLKVLLFMFLATIASPSFACFFLNCILNMQNKYPPLIKTCFCSL